MATWRNWRNILPIGLAAIAGVLMAACSSEPARVLTESDGDAPSAAVAEPTETIASFLAGTVWIVDDIDTITPYGPDADRTSRSTSCRSTTPRQNSKLCSCRSSWARRMA